MLFNLATSMNDLEGLRDVYRVRATGLHDPYPSNYQVYRVPDPEAPYPQDYIIDKQGIVRFWEGEYDARICIDVIEELLEYQPPVTVDVEPDSTQVQPGGSLGYQLTLKNTTASGQDIEVSIVIINPDSTRDTVTGPQQVHLNAGKEISAHLSTDISGSAPLGSYSLKVLIGSLQSEVWSVDGFGFQVY